MANIYTALATEQNADLVASNPNGSLLTGDVKYAQCSYTTTSTTAADDVLYLAKLPVGAIVIPGLSFVDTEDCGTDISITIGDSDVDAYSTAISLGTAGRIAFASGIAGPNPAALTDATWIKATVVDAGSISVTAAKDFTVWLAFRMP
jgi:hypothetical protein